MCAFIYHYMLCYNEKPSSSPSSDSLRLFWSFFLGHTISQVSASRLTTHRNDAAAFTIVPQIFVVICVSTVILIPTGSTVVFYLNQETLSFLQAVFSQV